MNGENTAPGQPFDHNSIADPSGAYAESKYQAEQGLREIAKKHWSKIYYNTSTVNLWARFKRKLSYTFKYDKKGHSNTCRIFNR